MSENLTFGLSSSGPNLFSFSLSDVPIVTPAMRRGVAEGAYPFLNPRYYERYSKLRDAYGSKSLSESAEYLKQFATKHNLILGSSSSSRRGLFAHYGIPLTGAFKPDFDEFSIRYPEARKLVSALSFQKVSRLVATAPWCSASRESPSGDIYLVGSDSVLVYKGAIREKPESKEEALKFLLSYDDPAEPVWSVTGVTVAVIRDGVVPVLTRTEVDVGAVHIRNMSHEIASKLANDGLVMHCSAAIAVELLMEDKCLERIEGDITGIIGIPMVRLAKMLGSISEELESNM